MKRWTGYTPVPGTIVKQSEGFTSLALPDYYWHGKNKLRVRVVMWPDMTQALTPVVDGVSIKQPTYGIERGALSLFGEYTDSTISAHTGADNGNSNTGRADRVADRLVLGNYPLPTRAGAHGTYIDTAVGCRAWAAAMPFSLFTLDTVLCPKWEDGGGGWGWDPARFWIIATPHPEGGVSFVRMIDYYAGLYWGEERWFCDAPELMFGGRAPEGHKPILYISEWSDDVPPSPYGYLYMCEACRKQALAEGRKDKGFGGDNSANRLIKLIMVNGQNEDGEDIPGACANTTYSSPATASGRSYEFYYGHTPLHGTIVTANPVSVNSVNGVERLKPIRRITDPGEVGEAVQEITAGWKWSNGETLYETWGRNYDPRGLMLGEISTRGLAQPNMRMFDPYFSNDRPTPEMLESDFLAPRQWMDAKHVLRKSYPVGEWSLPPEVIYKWKTKPDPIFNESLPIDEPLNMRVFNMGLKDRKKKYVAGEGEGSATWIWVPNRMLDTVWEVLVEANHFYIGSNSSTVGTGKAKHHIDRLLMGEKELREAFTKAMLWGAVGGVGGLLIGGLSAINGAINNLNLIYGNLVEPKYGAGGSGDKPTRYVRTQYDTEKRLYTVTLANNEAERNVVLPNGQLMFAKERRIESRFGCVPSISGYFDQRGEIVVMWPHSKRWMQSPSLVMQVAGVEQQYVIEKYRAVTGEDSKGRKTTEEKVSEGWAANPNRVHRPADYGVRNVQASTDETERYVALVWDQHLDNGHYIPYVQLVDKHRLFAPRGVIRSINGGGKAFIPSESFEHFKSNDGDGKVNRGTELVQRAEDGVERLADAEMDRPQDWRHVYPLPIGKTQVVLLIGDKELICDYDPETGVMNPVTASNAATVNLSDTQAPVSHIFLRVLPFGLFNPRPGDAGDGATAVLNTGVFEGPKYNSEPLAQGYNPTATYDNKDVHVFFNSMSEPGRVPPLHGGGFCEFEVNISPGDEAQVKVYGAEMRTAPGGSSPAVQCYVAAYPARTPVRHMRIPASKLGSMLNTYTNPAETEVAESGQAETAAVEAMLRYQDTIADELTNNTEDLGLLVARCGPQLTNKEFRQADSRITGFYNAYIAKHAPPKPYNDKNPGTPKEWEDYANAITDYVYNAMAGYLNLSRRQILVFLYDKLMGTPIGQTAVKLALRTYFTNQDDDVRCPKCGAIALFCTDVVEGLHQIGTFRCAACGHEFTDDCHYIEMEYVDAACDPARGRIWLVGGIYDTNLALGCDEGFPYITSKIPSSGIWGAERVIMPNEVDYKQIVDENPGPNDNKAKPYLWDTADTRQWSTDSSLPAEGANNEVDKLVPPVEDGLDHISFIPPHKPKIMATKRGLTCLLLTREYYDAALSKRGQGEDEEELQTNPGDHIASTASPSIPRTYYSRDGFLWDSDYHKVWKREAPEADIYVQPKRDWWELPLDLKDKTGHG